MNKAVFTGRLTSDPELKNTQSGVPVCSFILAVKRPRVKDKTDFINFVAW
jgi:single-strand DNA-binding protein